MLDWSEPKASRIQPEAAIDLGTAPAAATGLGEIDRSGARVPSTKNA